MTLKIFTGFKRLATPSVTLLCFLAMVNRAVPAAPLYPPGPDQKQPEQHPVMIAQSETRTTTQEKSAPSSESDVPESKTQEKKESDEAREKPLKEFRPSERIEAEQAVDFPYDI